jgi:hypothetical protein
MAGGVCESDREQATELTKKIDKNSGAKSFIGITSSISKSVETRCQVCVDKVLALV